MRRLRSCRSLFVYSFRPSVPIQRQDESRAPPWIKMNWVSQRLGSSFVVTRSRRSSVWPSPFSTPRPTSQSGTVADPGEESSPRGTEAVCLCSGRVGRSRTGWGGRAGRAEETQVDEERRREKKGVGKKTLT